MREIMKKMPSEHELPKHIIEKALNVATELLKDEGGKIEESSHDYQCFTFKDKNICLVFYPHRTTARNYHIRVRDQGSKNKSRANKLMAMLAEDSGYNCTFSRKI